MSKELEEAMEAAGFAISDTPPTEQPTENVTEQPLAEPTTEPVQEQAVVEQTAVEDSAPVTQPEAQPSVPVQEPITNESESFSGIDVDSEVLKYLSEKLGTELSGYDALTDMISNKPEQIDERVAAINDFVKKTGRSPEDWYKYQQLNPSEMDDMTAVRNQMVIQHDNLSLDEINMLVGNKYRMDADRYDDNDVAMAKLQLKMDAETARKSISELRDGYQLPVNEQGETEVQSPITEDWLKTMSAEVQDFDGLIFELPSGEKFTYGIKDDYRKTLAAKNTQLEQYFDDYVNEGGDWNFEKLNADRAVIDNIDSIVQSVYQQGMSDGQKKVVQSAANVSNESAQRDTSQQSDGIAEQLRNALGGGSTMTFNI
jgi:hypothetical protein|tara:strand:- start:2268 stop:3380 length:1113 start_codon:yes stop_codon:yes gene_type:complete